jgi:hypothetical protein
VITPGVLVSYHYLRRGRFTSVRSLDNLFKVYGQTPVVLDSGAFSARQSGASVPLMEFGKFIRREGHRFHWVASLDVIGNPQVSMTNWRLLRRYHPVVPTIHAGTDLDFLRYYIGEGVDRVAFGGMVGESGFRQLARNTSEIRAWLDDAFLLLVNQPQIQVHAFGLTNREVLDPYPWHTADSTSALLRAMFNQLNVSQDGKWRPTDPLTVDPEIARRAFSRFEVQSGKTRSFRYAYNVLTLTAHLENTGISYLYHAHIPNRTDEHAAIQGCGWYVQQRGTT